MRCSEAKRFMQMTLAGDATGADHERLDDHIANCPRCEAQWRALTDITRQVEAATPSVGPAAGSLEESIMRSLPARRLTGARQAARTRRLAGLLAGAGVLLALGWLLHSRPGSIDIIAVVEAATKVQPTHQVMRMFDATGTALFLTEQWRYPDGAVYSEHHDLVSGERTVYFNRPRDHVTWTHELGTNEYDLSWTTPMPIGEKQHDLGDTPLPPVLTSEHPTVVGWLLEIGALTILNVTEAQKQWHGQTVRVFHVETKASETEDTPVQLGDRFTRCEFTYFLTPDLSRLVRRRWRCYNQDGEQTYAHDVWPIEYDVEPPVPQHAQLPMDGSAVFSARSLWQQWEEIDPVWEYMDEGEKQEIIKTVLALGDAWRDGDFEEFTRHYDFRAGQQYGVKGKFTAEETRECWQGMVTRQRERWADWQLTVDYGFASPNPPPMALGFFSIYRENPQSGDGWHLYRQEPSEEPGIVVLARVKVTEHDGQTRKLRTRLFVKKINGEYKVILWRPPFA